MCCLLSGIIIPIPIMLTDSTSHAISPYNVQDSWGDASESYVLNNKYVVEQMILTFSFFSWSLL